MERARVHLQYIFFILCPSFIQTLLWDSASHNSSAQENNATHNPINRKHRHAYLDGLRALAAISVFVFHLFSPFDLTISSGYGPRIESQTILNLPVIRLVHAGQAVVKVFFVISGFVLTIKPAEFIFAAQDGSDQLQKALGTAIVKRGVRLFVPPVVTTLCAMCLAYAGAMMAREDIIKLPTGLLYFGIVQRPTFGLQVLDWLHFVATRLVNPWVWVDGGWDMLPSESPATISLYGPHLWTILTEFRCSMVLFTIIAAVARVPKGRLQDLLSLLIILYSAGWARWDVALFISGMLCCMAKARRLSAVVEEKPTANGHVASASERRHSSVELHNQPMGSQAESTDLEALGQVYHDLIPRQNRWSNLFWSQSRRYQLLTPTSSHQGWFLPDALRKSLSKLRDRRIPVKICRHFVLWTALLCGLWLLSYPERMEQGALGFEHLRVISPDPDLWQSIGAVFLVGAIGEIPIAQYVLSSSILQYLGKVSFSFYLVHVPVLETLGWRVANAWKQAADQLQNGSNFGSTTVELSPGTLSVGSHVITFCFLFLVTLYFADFVWKYVDRPCTALLARFHSVPT